MDHRLENIDKLLSTMPDEDEDMERELSFALGFARGGANEPDELRWLAACAAARAQELEDERNRLDDAFVNFANKGD